MAKLSLEGMEFYAHHGYYEEETILGGYYIVDVYLETDIVKAAAKDDLNMAINYETIYLICKTVMSRPNKLIETVVERIALGVKHQYKNIKDITVIESSSIDTLNSFICVLHTLSELVMRYSMLSCDII